MPREERDRVVARIAEIQQVLRNTSSEDLRLTLLQALADCEHRLSELDAMLEPRLATEPSL